MALSLDHKYRELLFGTRLHGSKNKENCGASHWSNQSPVQKWDKWIQKSSFVSFSCLASIPKSAARRLKITQMIPAARAKHDFHLRHARQSIAQGALKFCCSIETSNSGTSVGKTVARKPGAVSRASESFPQRGYVPLSEQFRARHHFELRAYSHATATTWNPLWTMMVAELTAQLGSENVRSILERPEESGR